MSNFTQYYRNKSGAAVYHRVPIQFLEMFRSEFPGKYRIRYRGPRKGDNRSPQTRQSTCLKNRAVCFSAYSY